MRIVYVVNARLPTEKANGYQISKTCEAFAQHGAEVIVLHPYRYQDDPELRRLSLFDYYRLPPAFRVRTLPNIDVLRWQAFLPRAAFSRLRVVHALLWGLYATLAARRYAADVYFTRNPEVAYWLVKRGMPTVFEAHTVPNRLFRRILRSVSRQPSLRRVIALTTGTREELIEIGFDQGIISVVPDAVDLSSFERLPSKEECRHRLGLPRHSAIVGYIGRFQTMSVEKGVPELLQAMARLRSSASRERLLLCVGGPMDAVPGYLEQAASLGLPEVEVRFVDRVPNSDVPYWMRACDVGTLPFPWTEHYAYYASPMKLFEYMAAGVPIVASRLPSLCEVLRHDENAWLVEPGDPAALAEGIDEVLSHRDRSASLARQAAIDVRAYSWSNRAAHILDALGPSTEGAVD